MSGVGKGWLRGGQGVVEDPTDSTRGVDCGVACGVAIVGWSGVVRVDSHCGVVWGGQGWSGVDRGGLGWTRLHHVLQLLICHVLQLLIYRSYRLQATGFLDSIWRPLCEEVRFKLPTKSAWIV